MNKKFRKLIKDPKAYFYDYFRKQIRNHPKGFVSLAVRIAFANAKTDLGYGKEIRRYLKEGNLDFAERICLEGMSVVPKAIRPYVLYAEISMRRGGGGYFKDAIRRWKTVAEKFPNKPEGYAGEERVYVALGDFEHAEVLCKNRIKNMPQELWPYIELAEISMRQSDFSEALRRWDTVREKFPDIVPGYVRASVACCSLEKFAEAEELCRECMMVAPEDYRPYAEYAEVSLRQRDFPTAVERWNSVRETFPREPAGYIRGAYAYCQIKDFSRAEELCRNYMEIAPNNISPFCEYAEISMRKCEYNEASNRWEIVRDKFPNHAQGYLGGSRAYMEMHEYANAKDVCKLGINVMDRQLGSSRDLYYCLIDMTMRQHERAKDCIGIFYDIEQTYTKTIKDTRYYSRLSNVLVKLIGRDKEDVDSPNTDFILIRLLHEPLNYSSTTLHIFGCFYQLNIMYIEIENIFKKHLQTLLIRSNFNNPTSVLLSDASSDEDRYNAHIEIIRDGCYHNIELCTKPENKKMLEKACDAIVESCEWSLFNPYKLFNFSRAMIFANQDKGDDFIRKVYDLYKDKNIPVSDPIGVLCFRHIKRQYITEIISKHYMTMIDRNKKLNIAVCISGQLRGYKDNLKSLINAIGLNSHNYRVFVHTWSNIGRHFPAPGRVNNMRVFNGEFAKTYNECFVNKGNLEVYIKKHFPEFYSLIVNSSEAPFKDLRKEYNSSDIVIDNEDFAPFASWSNQEKMHYKIYAAHQLAVKSKERFDLIIRVRPDLNLGCEESVDLYDIYEKSVSNASIVVIGGMGKNHIDDKFAIGIPEAMDAYANTYLDFGWHLQNSTYSRTKEFYGHQTLEHNLFCNGIHIDKFQNKFTSKLREPDKISSHDVYDALCKDVKNRTLTAEDHHLLDACKRDMAH